METDERLKWVISNEKKEDPRQWDLLSGEILGYLFFSVAESIPLVR